MGVIFAENGVVAYPNMQDFEWSPGLDYATRNVRFYCPQGVNESLFLPLTREEVNGGMIFDPLEFVTMLHLFKQPCDHIKQKQFITVNLSLSHFKRYAKACLRYTYNGFAVTKVVVNVDNFGTIAVHRGDGCLTRYISYSVEEFIENIKCANGNYLYLV